MKYLLLVFALIISNLISAQTLRSINGQVKQPNGNAIAGASIVILNSGKGAVSKTDGSFAI
ncbi:MAG TPA: carboxypeptidase-like regulatory domain-containing protein, partial [Chitinophagaceae bacterium]|nr:carboxypeptidase-like regulatory domain-containing protein [Chitinophagaceae bacterium]